MPVRRAPLLLAASAAVLLLTGCVPAGETGPSASPPSSGSPSPSSTPSASSAPDPAAEPTSEPVTIGCNDLISRDDMYAYSPQFTLLDTFDPARGSLAAEALAADGIACRWVNETSGETIDISVAHLLDPALAAKRNEVGSSSTPVQTFGVEGYFEVEGAAGVAQAFPGAYWVTAVSPAFLEAGDVAQLMDYAVDDLG